MYTWCDLTEKFPIKFDLEKMREECSLLEDKKWLGHYDPTLSRDWKAMPLVSIDGHVIDEESQRGTDDLTQMKRTELLEELPYFKSLLDALRCPQGRIRILKLEPGAGISMHRDIRHEVANLAFRKVRLHVPIHTNKDVVFNVDGENIRMETGHLYYVNFSKKHYVSNGGDTARIHLVLDLVVNDWLKEYFPKTTVFDELGFALQRIFLPIYWDFLKVTGKIKNLFWRLYEGSALQRFRHRILPKG